MACTVQQVQVARESSSTACGCLQVAKAAGIGCVEDKPRTHQDWRSSSRSRCERVLCGLVSSPSPPAPSQSCACSQVDTRDCQA